MEQFNLEAARRFKNPEEEIRFLREEISRRERNMEKAGIEGGREAAVKETIAQYKTADLDNLLHKEYKIAPKKAEEIILELSPETHDRKMEELLSLMNEKGVKNALAIADKLGSPHVEDDFHRFLVQYLKEGLPIKDLREKDPLYRALKMTLYEVSLPGEEKEEDQKKALKELVSKMEQFYAGMRSVSPSKGDRNYFTLEVANENGSTEVIFYVCVPDEHRDLFEKQILSIFPYAKIAESKNDYNIFNDAGASAGSVAASGRKPIFPIKTYDTFDYDPLNIVLNAFSSVKQAGEGAAVQLVFRPAGDFYLKEYKSILDDINKGKKTKEAIARPHSFGEHVVSIGKEFLKSEKKGEKEKEKGPVDQIAVKMIEEKISSPITEVNIRVLASAEDEKTALEVLSHIESAFNQFENAQGNKLEFKRAKGKKLAKLGKDFSFRLFSDDEKIPLSIKEITSMLHFPQNIKGAPELRQAKAGTSPAPIGMPTSGTLLGVNKNRNVETKIYMKAEDRLRHFYTIGQTGTGKTTLLKNMITQDILRGDGVCMIDPHGSDIKDILAIIPKERYEDVIYFDPANVARPMALNMLEYDRRFPEQKTFVVNELFSIFNKLFDMKTAGGPMFEQYFRNAAMLVIEDPDSGSTLLEVSRVMSNKAFREMKLSKCKNPIVTQFWKEVAEKAGGEASLANIVPYITSKFDVFLANEIMRPIIAQEKSSFNFREIMDNKKILLVNLSKGRLGDINSSLIGLILVGKILMAALSRVDSLSKDMPPFYLYIDEFQNITTDSIATILSEARKYKLSLNIAHQFIGQLEDEIKDAVFGNVGSIAAFRVGAEDAEFLEKQFAPVFTARDIMNLDNFNAYLKLLVDGKPMKPFNIETMRTPKGNPEIAEKLKELSYLKFGRPREEVEAEVMKKYSKAPAPAPAAGPTLAGR